MLRLSSRVASVREKRQMAWKYIYTNEKILGSQLIRTIPDSRLYISLGATREILALPPKSRAPDRVLGYLYEMYGMDAADPNTLGIYDLMRLHATNEGIRAELRRFSAYDRTSRTSYISAYDGTMWKCDGQTAERITNGEEGMFFVDDDGGTPCEPEYGDNGILLDTLTNLNYENGPSGITKEQQRKFMIVWLFAQAFPDLMPDKPIMLLEGLKGSGKTLAPTLVQMVLMGQNRVMSISQDQDRDFGVLLLRAPIAILDNMDTYMEWIQDKICQYATQGKFPRRRLFSDDEEVMVAPKSYVAITSRNPASFRRDDVVDRLLIIRLKRYEGFRAVEKIMAEIKELRPRLLGEYLYHVNRIVDAIRAGGIEEDRIETWRMASFAAFVRLIGRVFGWANDEVQEMLDAMQAERDVFEGEGDPLVEIMQEWIVYRPRGMPSNIGREFALSELFKAFTNLASVKGITFYKHHNRLAERLLSNYVARYFRVTVRDDEKTGGKFFRIWRTTDPDLSAVEEDGMSIELAKPDDEPKITIRIIKP